MDEDSAFEEFLARHVTGGKECAVQCMLLWTEWLRFHMRTKGKRDFPEKIRLAEFNERIHQKFEPALAFDESRGPLYVGIKFVK